MLGDEDAPEVVALGVGDPDSAGTGAVDVALDVHLDAVGGAVVVVEQLGENAIVADGAVGEHVEHPDMELGGVVDVEEGLVGGKAQAVGVGEVIHQKGQAPVGEVELVNGLIVHVFLDVLALHGDVADAIGGVGEVDGAVGLHDDVVGGVELLAVDVGGEDGGGAVVFPAPHGAAAPAGDDEAAVVVVGHAVGLAGGLHDDAGALAGYPLPDLVVDDVGPDEKVLFPVPHRALGEDVAGGYFLEGGAGVDDAAEAGEEHLAGHPILLGWVAA